MLWTIAIILFVLWLIGWVGFHVLGGAIHILVILAIVFVVAALVKGICDAVPARLSRLSRKAKLCA